MPNFSHHTANRDQRSGPGSGQYGEQMTKDGKVAGVIWDSPAFDAGLTVGTQIVAVNGRAFDPDVLKAAIKAAAGSGPPARLIVQSGDSFRTVDLDWHGGLRYPRLAPTAGGKGTLDALLRPLR